MGVAGFTSWLQSAFPECFVTPPPAADHVFIDMNGLLHECFRKCKREQDLMQTLYTLLTECLRRHRPCKSLTLAIDGPAPLAKIEEQRRRRIAKGRKMESGSEQEVSGLSSLNVTIGTPFMRAVDEFLRRWAESGGSDSRSPPLPVRIVVDPSSNEGEGEVKLFRHLAAESNAELADDVHIVVGGDADLLLLALASDANRVLVHDPGSRRGAFAVDRFLASWAHTAAPTSSLAVRGEGDHGKGALDCPSGASLTAMGGALDFVLLAFMCGNDYLPKLRTYDLGVAVAAYRRTMEMGGALRLVSLTTSVTATAAPSLSTALVHLHLDALASLLSACIDQLRKRSSKHEEVLAATEQGGASGAQLEANALEYLSGLMWSMQMYVDAACPHYGWVPCTACTSICSGDTASGLGTPTLAELATALMDSDARGRISSHLRCPRSSRSAPSALVTPLLVLPARAAHLAIAPLRPLFDTASPLAWLFEQDRCTVCTAYRQSVKALASQRAAESKAMAAARQEAEDPAASLEGCRKRTAEGEPRTVAGEACKAIAAATAEVAAAAAAAAEAAEIEAAVPPDVCEMSSQETVVLEPDGDETHGGELDGGEPDGYGEESTSRGEVAATASQEVEPPAGAEMGSPRPANAGKRTPLQLELARMNQEYRAHLDASHPPISVHRRWDAVAEVVADLEFDTFSAEEMMWVRRIGPSHFDHQRQPPPALPQQYRQHPVQQQQHHQRQHHQQWPPHQPLPLPPQWQQQHQQPTYQPAGMSRSKRCAK